MGVGVDGHRLELDLFRTLAGKGHYAKIIGKVVE